MPTHIVSTTNVLSSSIEDIKQVIGKDIISLSYPTYLCDESKLDGGFADYLFFPTNESQIVAIINMIREKKSTLTISGARTGVVGSAVPFGGAVISFDEMKSIIGLDYDKNTSRWFVRLQPGVTLLTLQEVLSNKDFTDEHNLSVNNAVQEFKETDKKYFYPVDPTELTASLGGCVGANASGARSFKYGATRKWIKRLRVVLSSGEAISIERGEYMSKEGKFLLQTEDGSQEISLPHYVVPKAKNAAGLYVDQEVDLIDVFIGSEGIIGVITEIDLWLVELPQLLSNVLFFKSEGDAIKFVQHLKSNNILKPEFIEYFDSNSFFLLHKKQEKTPNFLKETPISAEEQCAIFFDLEYKEEEIENVFNVLEKVANNCNSSLDCGFCGYDKRERDNLRKLRHAIPEIVNDIISKRKRLFPKLHKLGTDMSVTDEHLEDMMQLYHKLIREKNLDYAIWGHIGDNHVHVNILPKDMQELETGKEIYMQFALKAIEYNGSISAEHGIGKIKHKYLEVMYGEKGIEEMKRLKLQFDPLKLFNIGNMFSL